VDISSGLEATPSDCPGESSDHCLVFDPPIVGRMAGFIWLAVFYIYLGLVSRRVVISAS